MKNPQLIISITLVHITENFEYALKSADRPRPSKVFHITQRRHKYYLATGVHEDSYGSPAETHAKCEKVVRTELRD